MQPLDDKRVLAEFGGVAGRGVLLSGSEEELDCLLQNVKVVGTEQLAESLREAKK